jgi:predicted PurR-regulated permease PerM
MSYRCLAPLGHRYAPRVDLPRLIVRQVLFGAVVGAVIAFSRGIPTGIVYGILFVVISTPIAYWVEQRRARLRDEESDAPRD